MLEGVPVGGRECVNGKNRYILNYRLLRHSHSECHLL